MVTQCWSQESKMLTPLPTGSCRRSRYGWPTGQCCGGIGLRPSHRAPGRKTRWTEQRKLLLLMCPPENDSSGHNQTGRPRRSWTWCPAEDGSCEQAGFSQRREQGTRAADRKAQAQFLLLLFLDSDHWPPENKQQPPGPRVAFTARPHLLPCQPASSQPPCGEDVTVETLDFMDEKPRGERILTITVFITFCLLGLGVGRI